MTLPIYFTKKKKAPVVIQKEESIPIVEELPTEPEPIEEEILPEDPPESIQPEEIELDAEEPVVEEITPEVGELGGDEIVDEKSDSSIYPDDDPNDLDSFFRSMGLEEQTAATEVTDMRRPVDALSSVLTEIMAEPDVKPKDIEPLSVSTKLNEETADPKKKVEQSKPQFNEDQELRDRAQKMINEFRLVAPYNRKAKANEIYSFICLHNLDIDLSKIPRIWSLVDSKPMTFGHPDVEDEPGLVMELNPKNK